jgi:phosphate transport system permease protein
MKWGRRPPSAPPPPVGPPVQTEDAINFVDTQPVPAVSVAVVDEPPDLSDIEDVPRRPSTPPTPGDRVFRIMATGAASVSLVIVGVTLIFLIDQARPALSSTGIVDFFTTNLWNPTVGQFGVLGLLVGTILIATTAMVIAVPLAIGMALFINEYAPGRLRRVLTSVIDLLAALPSLLFGVWGFFALQSRLVPAGQYLSDHFSVVPLFSLSTPNVTLAQSTFVAGIVVAAMILPIVTSVSRDVMAQCPRDQCEAALALGGTRWGMIRSVILPFGKSGIVGAALLGFGRALGETIAVAIIISLVFKANFHILERGAGSIAALIATRFGEANSLERSGLVAAGLALFLLTLVVNFIARRIVNRSAVV